MIGRIKYIADIYNNETEERAKVFPQYMEDTRLEEGTFSEFVEWFHKQQMYQFDIETNMSDWWPERKVISMQFGSCTSDRVQWFLQWSKLTPIQQEIVKDLLRINIKKKLIHNAAFEYIVMRFHGVILENVSDTMLYEKVLHGGIENANYSLADISWKYLRIMMSKEEQTRFGNDIMTEKKVIYGITDVAYLDSIRRQQYLLLEQESLINVAGLEDEAVLAFSDCTYEGMLVSEEKWRENIKLAQPLVDEDFIKLNAWLFKAPFKDVAIREGFISDTDRIQINFNAPQQKKALLLQIFPDIPGASLPVIKKYIRDHTDISFEKLNVLTALQVGDHEPLKEYMLKYYRDWLIEREFVIPAGVVTINWISSKQVLNIMQCVSSKLTGVGEDDLAKLTHPIIKAYQDYKWALSLVTKLGEQWLEKNRSVDGYVRTNFNQIVSTGRVSSSNPNMQNITVDERIGTRYRNAFICEPGWSFVGSDYISQEIVIIAYLSKDPVWLEALRKGQDLHSICAELVYGKKWKDAADSDCAYYSLRVNVDGVLEPGHMKCNCKKHKSMRYDVKSINFGLAYGMSQFKLARDLEITINEALALLDKYFAAFPSIGTLLEFLGQYGVNNGYIMTIAPFNRKRWFPYWKEWSNYTQAHIEGIRYIPVLGEIERASKNHPIQGTAADCCKVAMVNVRNYIRDHNLWDKVKMQLQIHDEVLTKACDDFVDEWSPILHRLMIEAGQLIIPTGILGADTQKSKEWTK